MTEHNFGHRAVHVGPPKTALVQFLRTDPQTATVIHDQFQAVAPRIRENENVPALRSAAQMIAHQTVETIEVLAHVRRAGCNIYPRRRSKPEHRLRPVQYGHQPLQRSCIKAATHFDPASAAQLNHQNTIATRIPVWILPSGPKHFDRKNRSVTRWLSLVHPPTIFIQRSYCQAALPAKCFPQQSTGFKLRNQRLDLGLTAPSPHHSCFAHSSSPPLNEAGE